MMKISMAALLASAFVLSACASHQTSSVNTSTSVGKVAKADSGSCRSAGEGRKINGRGKNDVYFCSASAALRSHEAQEVLNPSISVSYGNVGGETLVSRQVANAVGKTPEETCQRAFLNAVKRFESTAERRNKKYVRVASYFDKKQIAGNQYECHIATWNSRVVLIGNVY